MGGIRLQATRGDGSIGFQLGEQVGVAAVSYTHLDVYKRQGYAYIVQASSTLGGLWQLLMGTALVPLEYGWRNILVDVYKRQP